MIKATRRVCISGAGIAGMSAAIALARKGIDVTLLEKKSHLEKIGTGIQLAPNATSLLHAWGILDSLYEYAVEPDGIDLKDGQTGNTLLHMPVYALSRSRWKAPYITVHRSDLQNALKTVIDSIPLIAFKTGHEIISYASSASLGFEINILHGKATKKIFATRLISCDGVQSWIRANLSEKAVFSGYVAWRTTLLTQEIPTSFLKGNNLKNISVWVGANGHFLAYPLKNGTSYNFVAITYPNPNYICLGMVDTDVLLNFFNGWNSTLVDIIKCAKRWMHWPLFKMPFPRFLGPSGEIFLGDASHALLPFTAQGASMAIEDAAALAAAFSAKHLSEMEALLLFNRERCRRLKMVIRRNSLNRFVYHAIGPIAFFRNLVMKMRYPEKFLTDLDWLYSYNASCFC